jgi:hypothetical protein
MSAPSGGGFTADEWKAGGLSAQKKALASLIGAKARSLTDLEATAIFQEYSEPFCKLSRQGDVRELCHLSFFSPSRHYRRFLAASLNGAEIVPSVNRMPRASLLRARLVACEGYDVGAWSTLPSLASERLCQTQTILIARVPVVALAEDLAIADIMQQVAQGRPHELVHSKVCAVLRHRIMADEIEAHGYVIISSHRAAIPERRQIAKSGAAASMEELATFNYSMPIMQVASHNPLANDQLLPSLLWDRSRRWL